MTIDIFKERIEKRFLIPKNKSKILVQSLIDFKPYQPNGMDKTYLQSIYFGRHGEVNKKGLIRIRKYGNSNFLGNNLVLKKNEKVYFEIKYKHDGKIDKKRCITNYGEVIQKLSKPSKAIIWFVDKIGFKKHEANNLFEEFDFLGLYPQFAILTKRTHYHSTNSKLNSRITLDQNIKYFAFKYGDPYQGIKMGSEPMDKLEIKTDEISLNSVIKIEKVIADLGGFPIDTLQGKVEMLCKETIKMFNWIEPSKETNSSIESTPMHSLRNMEKIFENEFKDEEFEMKIQISPLKPRKLINEIRKKLIKGQIEGFSLPEDKNEISWWIYFMDYYGYLDNKKTKVAFSIIRHPDKNKFMVQFKGDVNKYGGDKTFVVVRKEFIFRVERKFQLSDLELFLPYYEKLIDAPINYVGTNRRKKYYLFLLNNDSKRYYNLCVDLNKCQDKKMVQLEIEYKGKHPDSSVPNDKNAVLKEMTKLIKEIKKIPNFNLSVTDLRKFDWIKSIQNIK